MTDEKTYKFSELSPVAQDRAIQDNLYICVEDDWWHCSVEDMAQTLESIGINTYIDRLYHHAKDGKRRIVREPQVYFGLHTQGLGACFEGTYSYNPDAIAHAMEYCEHSDDQTLLESVLKLYAIQRVHKFGISVRCTHQGSYSHENSVSFDGDHINICYDEEGWPSDEEFELVYEILRDIMKWMYRFFDNEYDYLTSEEYIRDYLTDCADYLEFDIDGVKV